MGVWMSLGVDDVDQMHKHCVAAGLEVTFRPISVPLMLNQPSTVLIDSRFTVWVCGPSGGELIRIV